MQSKSVDVIILVCAIFIGLLVRFYQLDLVSPWYDEIASIYYAAHLNVVFFEETHTPLFYLFLMPFVSLFEKDVAALRFVVVTTGLIINCVSVFLSRKIFNTKGVLLLAVILLLNHVDYHHGRMVRQYGIMFDLTVLLFIMSQIREMKGVWTTFVSIILSWIHPLGFLVPLALLVDEFITTKKLTPRVSAYGISILSVVFYYLSRILFLTHEDFKANYDLPQSLTWEFAESVLRGLSGEYYPRMNFYNISIWPQIIIIGFICLIFGLGIYQVIRKRRLDPLFQKTILLIAFASFFVIGFSIFAFNIQIARYFIFLLAPLIVCFVSWAQRINYVQYFTLGFLLVLLLELNPFLHYEGERDAFNEYQTLKKENQNLGLVMCATKAQYYFYLDSNQVHCPEQLEEMKKSKKDFYFVSMNGYGLHILSNASKEYRMVDTKRRGVVISLTALRK